MKKYKLQGEAFRVGSNKNGRYYNSEAIREIFNGFNDNNIGNYGELNHPNESNFMSSVNISHKVNKLFSNYNRVPRKLKKKLKNQGSWVSWRDNNLSKINAEIELIDTEAGNTVKRIFNSNIPLTLSLRSHGTVDDDGLTHIKKFISFDIIGLDESSMNKKPLRR